MTAVVRLGRVKKRGASGPGLFFIIPCIDDCKVVDLRTVSFDVPPQEILTKDSVTVTVDAVVNFNVYAAELALCSVDDFSHSTRLLAATTLRNVLGNLSLRIILFCHLTVLLQEQKIFLRFYQIGKAFLRETVFFFYQYFIFILSLH